MVWSLVLYEADVVIAVAKQKMRADISSFP
jgi:hypothetical protein